MKQFKEFWEVFDIGDELMKQLLTLHYLRVAAADPAIRLEAEMDYGEAAKSIVSKYTTHFDNPDILMIHGHLDSATNRLAICFRKFSEIEDK